MLLLQNVTVEEEVTQLNNRETRARTAIQTTKEQHGEEEEEEEETGGGQVREEEVRGVGELLVSVCFRGKTTKEGPQFRKKVAKNTKLESE